MTSSPPDALAETRRRVERERLEALAVGGGFALLYAAGAATTAQGGDASEFMAAAGAGGVVHPPGYPLFTWLVKAAAALVPFGSVAWRASLVAALQGGAALGVLYAVARALTGRALPALLAAGSLGFSLHFWRYATVAEVFAGGALTCALTLAAALHLGRSGGGPRAGLLFGLALASGIANHHTVVTLFPLGVYALIGLLRGARPAAAIAAGAAGLAPGFVAYLALMPDDGGWRWGHTETLAGLTHHFLRRDYGTFQLALSDADVGPLDHPLYWLGQLPREFFGVFALLGVIGLAAGWRRERGFVAAAAASLLTAGPLFLSAFNLPAEGDSLVITSRFHLLPNTIFALFVALGAERVLAWSGSRAVGVALAAALAGPLAVNARLAPHRGWTVLEDYLLNALRVVEPDALVLGAGDPMLFGMAYAREVLGVRPDVAYISPNMLAYSWYRDQLRERYPDLTLEVDGGWLDGPALVAANRQRPTYLRISMMSEPTWAGLTVYPVGAVLMKVPAPGEALPPPAEVERELRAALAEHTLRSRVETHFEATQTWEYKDYDQYAMAFDALANAWRATGDPEGEARCRGTAAALSPQRFPAP